MGSETGLLEIYFWGPALDGKPHIKKQTSNTLSCREVQINRMVIRGAEGPETGSFIVKWKVH